MRVFYFVCVALFLVLFVAWIFVANNDNSRKLCYVLNKSLLGLGLIVMFTTVVVVRESKYKNELDNNEIVDDNMGTKSEIDNGMGNNVSETDKGYDKPATGYTKIEDTNISNEKDTEEKIRIEGTLPDEDDEKNNNHSGGSNQSTADMIEIDPTPTPVPTTAPVLPDEENENNNSQPGGGIEPNSDVRVESPTIGDEDSLPVDPLE